MELWMARVVKLHIAIIWLMGVVYADQEQRAHDEPFYYPSQ